MRARGRLLTFTVPLGIMTGVCWGAWADNPAGAMIAHQIVRTNNSS